MGILGHVAIGPVACKAGGTDRMTSQVIDTVAHVVWQCRVLTSLRTKSIRHPPWQSCRSPTGFLCKQ